MLCSETDSRVPAVKIVMPVDLARDISYLIEGIKALGGTGRITLDISGGQVIGTETTIKRRRDKKQAS
jgi:hypothetical protein